MMHQKIVHHFVPEGVPEFIPKPSWLSITPPTSSQFQFLQGLISRLKLVTVCQEAHCPNMSECWSKGTATFMILGDSCTRGCRFRNVTTRSRGKPVDPQEPAKLIEAVGIMNLDYIVITSVDRDDLHDQGAGHFAACITALKTAYPHLLVEVLLPDFRGDLSALQHIINARPNVISHNIETVDRLQSTVRDRRANYRQSLAVLDHVKKINTSITTKSSLMLGLGETQEEVCAAMDDLRSIGVDIITFGQYLRPSFKHLPVHEYVHPDQFERYKEIALSKGFMCCASGPFVRSSYRAGELFMRNQAGKSLTHCQNNGAAPQHGGQLECH